MKTLQSVADRRKDERFECDHIIRWKRPGRFEDNKAWSSDRSPTSLGFITETRNAPAVSEVLHVRRLNVDRWVIESNVIRVARVTRASSPDLSIIGCTLAEPEKSPPAPVVDRPKLDTPIRR